MSIDGMSHFLQRPVVRNNYRDVTYPPDGPAPR